MTYRQFSQSFSYSEATGSDSRHRQPPHSRASHLQARTPRVPPRKPRPGACLPHLQARAAGFTLFELMVVIAIVAILAAAAIPAYQGYVENANMAKVNNHFEHGVRFARAECRKIQTKMALGSLTPAAADTQYSATGWVTALNGDGGGLAPGGGAAFAAEASAVTGAIGVAVEGAIADGDLVVTITRPGYAELSEETRQINWSDL